MRGILLKILYPCGRVRDLLYEYLEGGLSGPTAVRFHLHLATCPGCREYLFLYRTAADARAFRAGHPAPEACLDATLEFLRKEGIVDGDGERPRVTDPRNGPTYRPDRG